MGEDVKNEDVIHFQTNVIINGCVYYQSLAQQLAKHVCCQKYDEKMHRRFIIRYRYK